MSAGSILILPMSVGAHAFDSLDDVRQAGNERTCGH
jgi:hypothetical protein